MGIPPNAVWSSGATRSYCVRSSSAIAGFCAGANVIAVSRAGNRYPLELGHKDYRSSTTGSPVAPLSG